MAQFCWEIRGCEEQKELFDHCPHRELGGRCPVDCAFTECNRDTHKVATDVMTILEPTCDRSKAIKERCCLCEFFLLKGPRLPEDQMGDEE